MVGGEWQTVFQSSLPRGERHSPIPPPSHLSYFNPRSREGSDYIELSQMDVLDGISILAPARGATICRYSIHDPGKFQSSLPRGERLAIVRDIDNLTQISILAPARGATAILAKSLPIFSAKINKLFFLYSPLLFFPLPFLL